MREKTKSKKENNQEKIKWHQARWFRITKKIAGAIIIYIIAFAVTMITLIIISKLLNWKSENISNEFVFLVSMFLGNLGIAWWLKFRKTVGIFLLSFVLTIVVLFYTPLKNPVGSYIWATSQTCDAHITFSIAEFIILPFFPLGILILFFYIRKNKVKMIHSGMTNFITELGLGALSLLISIIVIIIMVWLVHIISGAGWCGT